MRNASLLWWRPESQRRISPRWNFARNGSAPFTASITAIDSAPIPATSTAMPAIPSVIASNALATVLMSSMRPPDRERPHAGGELRQHAVAHLPHGEVAAALEHDEFLLRRADRVEVCARQRNLRARVLASHDEEHGNLE